ncbi:MAG: Holliday junction branch migration protein RuvA [Alloprevotella sp.]|nr:Holliday junction branch migration protein RuvA [Alloprevotella sp.]
MIEYIRGELAELTPTEATIEAAGVGYLLGISLNTYSALQGKREAKLFAYESIREDAYQLFGFATKQERELFTLLVGISGVGGQTARTILSAFTPTELVGAIQGEDVRALKAVKGIGPKAAQRIIVELKDKVLSLVGEVPAGGGATAAAPVSAAQGEATGALTTLGFPPAIVHKTVTAILKDDPTLSVEQVIKKALKML